MGVPTRSEGFNGFLLLFQLCASQTVHRNIVNGKTLISSIIQYPLIDLCSFYFAKCKGTQRPDISGVGHTGKICSTGYIRC